MFLPKQPFLELTPPIHFHTKWDKLEKSQADVFQVYLNLILFNPLQVCPSMALVGFYEFVLSISTCLNCCFDFLGNSITNFSVLKKSILTLRDLAPFKPVTKRWKSKPSKGKLRLSLECPKHWLNNSLFLNLLFRNILLWPWSHVILFDAFLGRGRWCQCRFGFSTKRKMCSY